MSPASAKGILRVFWYPDVTDCDTRFDFQKHISTSHIHPGIIHPHITITCISSNCRRDSGHLTGPEIPEH